MRGGQTPPPLAQSTMARGEGCVIRRRERRVLGLKGLVATISIEGGSDGKVFRRYIAQILASRLCSRQLVGIGMDKPKIHKVIGTRYCGYRTEPN